MDPLWRVSQGARRLFFFTNLLVFGKQIFQNGCMVFDQFDSEEAKRLLLAREMKEKQERETARKEVLERTTLVLREEFNGSPVEVYLVGSLTRPYSFTPHSDVDIVLKNYTGDRFDLWTKLEKKIGRSVEIISFETCSFQEFVIKEGVKVL
jgi:predicted nucleotidyltransferase